jgi:RNA polymerase sigma factor (sigma-70 family)
VLVDGRRLDGESDENGVRRPSDAFEAWYREAYPSIRASIAVLAGEDYGAEATAEAFARAYQHWPRVSRMESPSGWTFRVAHNLVRRRARRARVEATLWRSRPPPDQPDGDQGSPLALSTDLIRELQNLGPRMRLAVVLRYVADMTEADVAVAMGITRGGVSALLAKARSRLQVRLAAQEEQEEGV